MKSILVGVATFLVMFAAAARAADDTDALIALDKQWGESAVKGDKTVSAKLLADKVVSVDENGRAFEIPLPGASESAIVTQFGADAVIRRRFIAVETPRGKPKAFSLSEEQGLALESGRGPGDRVRVSRGDGTGRDTATIDVDGGS